MAGSKKGFSAHQLHRTLKPTIFSSRARARADGNLVAFKPILDGRQPRDLTADKLLAHSRLPLTWHEQRRALGFA